LKRTAEAPPIGRRLGLSADEETDEGYRFARKDDEQLVPGAAALVRFARNRDCR